MCLLKVGEVAQRTGITIRTLHHYDELGLLTPSHRSKSGYRLYALDDLMRLQQIKSLQQFGFSLQDIGGLADQDMQSLTTLLKEQIEKINVSIKQQRSLIKRLQLLVDKLDQHQKPSAKMLLDTLRMLTTYEKYYTPKQIAILHKRRTKLGEEAIQAAMAQWQDIFRHYQTLQKNNKPITCKMSQKLAKRAKALIDEYTGGDHEIEKSLYTMLRQEGGAKLLNQDEMKINDAVFNYFIQSLEQVTQT